MVAKVGTVLYSKVDPGIISLAGGGQNRATTVILGLHLPDGPKHDYKSVLVLLRVGSTCKRLLIHLL